MTSDVNATVRYTAILHRGKDEITTSEMDLFSALRLVELLKKRPDVHTDIVIHLRADDNGEAYTGTLTEIEESPI